MNDALEMAIASHRRGDVDGARKLARAALDREPVNVPILHFLGMVEARDGSPEVARSLFERALAADLSYAPALVSLARLLAKIEEWGALCSHAYEVPSGPLGDEYLNLRAIALERAGDKTAAANDLALLAARRPGDAPLAVGAARALADTGRFDQAERLYQRVLDQEPGNAEALLGLTGLLEALNRPAALVERFERARGAAAAPAILALGDAIARREAGDFASALVALDAARGTLPEAAWQQMRGALTDRAGERDAAFAAFAAMNAADRAGTPEIEEGIRRYRAEMAAELETLDAGRSLHPPPEARAAPLFLLGFPRSGTTLLDTFLMGHPRVQVHEERPYLESVARRLGNPRTRATLDDAALAALRAEYWQALDAETTGSKLLHVDKNPMATGRIALVDTLFPDAPILFMMRHPCDVVLSCFMTRFKLNWGVAAFLGLRETVDLYDRVMRVWTGARERRSLAVHDVRYEELIVRPADILRGVADFAGLDFDPAMLDHSRTARARGHIATPSHAQVVQPLHQRSVGKWRHYRSALEPHLPILRKWCDRFGYSLD